jgi:hypothetical protein
MGEKGRAVQRLAGECGIIYSHLGRTVPVGTAPVGWRLGKRLGQDHDRDLRGLQCWQAPHIWETFSGGCRLQEARASQAPDQPEERKRPKEQKNKFPIASHHSVYRLDHGGSLTKTHGQIQNTKECKQVSGRPKSPTLLLGLIDHQWSSRCTKR